MLSTRTGHFPIGFRPRNWAWAEKFSAVIRFATDRGFSCLDATRMNLEELRAISDAGLRIGSADLLKPWSDLVHSDSAVRQSAVERNAAWIESAIRLGVTNFFAVVIPDNHDRPRVENFEFAVDGFGRLAKAVEANGARIVLEGWPGRAPTYSSLACTPAELRELFARIDSPVMGINFDPSHLARMGIDALRFLDEFSSRVFHVHAKDTLFLSEAMYEYGNLQPPLRGVSHGFGGYTWRYTIPGRGVLPWREMLSKLERAGYRGAVSIELEDEDFAGSESAEQAGLIAAMNFLREI